MPHCLLSGPLLSGGGHVVDRTCTGLGRRGGPGRACVAGVGVPVPPDEVRHAGVPPVGGGALVVHVPGHVLQHGDVVHLRAGLMLLSIHSGSHPGHAIRLHTVRIRDSAHTADHLPGHAIRVRAALTCHSTHTAGDRIASASSSMLVTSLPACEHAGMQARRWQPFACAAAPAGAPTRLHAPKQAAVRLIRLGRMQDRHRAPALQRQRPWAPQAAQRAMPGVPWQECGRVLALTLS